MPNLMGPGPGCMGAGGHPAWEEEVGSPVDDE